jgi:hypothetical protein
MAIDYKATDALMRDPDFIGRTRIACLHFASYIDGEAEDVPAHNTRTRWARDTFENPDGSAAEIMPVLVMDPKVQATGAAITDVDLQSAVETSVNKTF